MTSTVSEGPWGTGGQEDTPVAFSIGEREGIDKRERLHVESAAVFCYGGDNLDPDIGKEVFFPPDLRQYSLARDTIESWDR